MKEFVRAEWQLYKKSNVRIALGLVFGGVYFFLQIFCPFATAEYCIISTLLGFLSFCYLFFPLYMTGISFGKKKKSTILVEKMLLCLGETKRVYLQIRLAAFFLLAAALCAGSFFFQFLLYFVKTEGFQVQNCFFTVLLLLSMIFFCGLSGLFFQGESIGYASGGSVGFVCGIASFTMNRIEEEGSLPFRVTGKMGISMLFLAAAFSVAFIAAFLVKYVRVCRNEKRG